MLKVWYCIVFSSYLLGADLQSLLQFAKEHNHLLCAKKITITAQKKELESVKSTFYPTVDFSSFYVRKDEASPFSPGTTYGATAKVGLDIYDGGKKIYTLAQKKDELDATNFSYTGTVKTTLLNITQDFYNLKSLYASLDARQEASKAVFAQLQRMQQFYEAKMATSDDVDRLQSAYDRNIYAIESLKFQIFSLKKSLELQVGKTIKTLASSKFKKDLYSTEETKLDTIRAMQYQKEALKKASETIDSHYYPNIRIEDDYTFFGYDDKPFFTGKSIPLLEKQNTIMLTLNLRIFDDGMLAKQKEIVLLQSQQLHEKIIYKSKEQKMHIALSLKRIETMELKIRSSRSALKSAKSALETITQKYNAGIVDNVVYLDALSSKTEAQALYEKALNDLEIAYAFYYYYTGKSIEEYLQ